VPRCRLTHRLVVGAWLLLALPVLACSDDGPDVVPFELAPVKTPAPLPADSPWREVSVEIESAPSSVEPGTVTEFVVAITNGSEREIDPDETCPAYFMNFGDSGISLEPVMSLLNCDAASPMPPGGVERFAMEMDVPSDFELDFGEFYWRLEELAADASSRSIPVRP
jgi:hypothetical protein